MKWTGPTEYEIAGPECVRASPADAGADLLAQSRLLRLVEEGRVDRGDREIHEPGFIEAEQLRGDLVLAIERGAVHRRVVAVDRHGHAGLGQGRQWMRRERFHRVGGDIRGWAHLEGDPPLGELTKQRLVPRGAGAVADALGTEHVERIADRLRPGRLTCMRHAVQTGRPRGGEVLRELRPRYADLRSAEEIGRASCRERV